METVEQLFLVLAWIAAVGFLVSGLDDLFFDAHFLVYQWRNRKKSPVSLKDLKLAQEQWIAIFVPAWQEGGVVNKMAEYAARVSLYEKYDIFIGVYPNDPETMFCVDKLCADNPRIHKVVVPHPGPTSKADCLNWIYRGMRLNEIPGVREYKIIALHDAEDIIHPLVLKVYNYYVPTEYDMAQLPVFPLELPAWKYWVGNTYIEEFSELHTKDLFVRQSMGGLVPSAGVGTAFARHTLERLAGENSGDPFRIGNLTEDYEIGIRIKRAGYRTGFVSYPVDRLVRRRRSDGTLEDPKPITEIVAIRESFPKTFTTAVRQRSRWILGISFQTWEQTGWEGTLPMRYTLLRDRRAPLTHLINMIGYVVFIFVGCQFLLAHSPWSASFYVRPIIDSNALLWKVVIIDTCLLGYRALQKFISVHSIYNLKQAFFSIPRQVINNVIGFWATMKATWMYLAGKFLNQPVVWLKTAHVFPGEVELAEYTKTIEDLIVETGLATRDQISRALTVEKAGSAPLCLLRMGLLDEHHFTDIWSRHSGIGVSFVNPYDIPASVLRLFPEEKLQEWEAVPVGQRGDSVVMAFREPPSKELLARYEQECGVALEVQLAPPSNIAFSRNRAYPRLVLPPSREIFFTDQFKQFAGVNVSALRDAIHRQHESHQSLPDVMVDMGLLHEPVARWIWAESLGIPPCELLETQLNQELYLKVGPSFWWLHRMLPILGGPVATAAPPHGQLTAWLESKMGYAPSFVAELPGKIALMSSKLGVEFDADKMLVEFLAGKGVLRREDVPSISAMRELISDPVPRWLLLQNMATEEQLHETFLQISHLPRVHDWDAMEIIRLASVLPPRFALDNGCFALRETEGGLVIGLAQLPSAKTLRDIHDRLTGYPVFFQSLSYKDACMVRELLQADFTPQVRREDLHSPKF